MMFRLQPCDAVNAIGNQVHSGESLYTMYYHAHLRVDQRAWVIGTGQVKRPMTGELKP